MNQEKFGKFIKDIRKQNNLTQNDLAEKYNVTYQAVSKWENGKNMPDMSLIKEMSKDFNISIEELLEGKKSNKNKNRNIYVITIGILLITLLVLIIYLVPKHSDFKFKTLSSECEKFNISGNIAYNNLKSAIYITNIKYCGEDNMELYKKIECNLYEINDDIEKKISSYEYNEGEEITLEEFLEMVTFKLDNYNRTCKEYTNNNLYLIINATDNEDKTITYKVPLSLKDCHN